MSKLAFLKSRRFWALIAIAIAGVLESECIITSDLALAIYTILGGFTAIRTVDRFSENV